MNVIFYSIWTFISYPGIETDMELICDHLEKGDNVYVLSCNKKLSSCSTNPGHDNNICILCNSKFKEAMKLIKFPKENIRSIIKKNINKHKLSNLRKHFSNLEEIKRYEVDGINIGMSVCSSIMSELFDHWFDIKKYEKLVNKKLSMAYSIYLSILDHFEEIKPDLVYVLNGRYADNNVVALLCEKLNIKYTAIERAGRLGRYILYRNYLPHYINELAKEALDHWNNSKEEKEKISDKWFNDKIKGINKYPFTKYQEEGLLPASFNKDNKNISIFCSSLEEFECIPGWRNPIYGNELVGIEKIANDFKSEKKYKLYLRVHPHLMGRNNTQIKELKRIESLHFKNFEIIWPESTISSYALMNNSDLVLTFGSTIGFEATYWGKPSIQCGRSLWEDYDCCYIPNTHEELISMLKSDLKPKKKENAMIFAYWEMTNGIPYKRFQTFLQEGKWGSDVFYKFLNNKLFIQGKFLDKLVTPKPNFIETLLLIPSWLIYLIKNTPVFLLDSFKFLFFLPIRVFRKLKKIIKKLN